MSNNDAITYQPQQKRSAVTEDSAWKGAFWGDCERQAVMVQTRLAVVNHFRCKLQWVTGKAWLLVVDSCVRQTVSDEAEHGSYVRSHSCRRVVLGCGKLRISYFLANRSSQMNVETASDHGQWPRSNVLGKTSHCRLCRGRFGRRVGRHFVCVLL